MSARASTSRQYRNTADLQWTAPTFMVFLSEEIVYAGDDGEVNLYSGTHWRFR